LRSDPDYIQHSVDACFGLLFYPEDGTSIFTLTDKLIPNMYGVTCEMTVHVIIQ
jgi:hypothetical protein